MDDKSNVEEIRELIRAQSEVLKTQTQATHLLLQRESEMFKQLTEISNDHEKRLRTLERVLAYGTGAVAVVLYLIKVFKG